MFKQKKKLSPQKKAKQKKKQMSKMCAKLRRKATPSEKIFRDLLDSDTMLARVRCFQKYIDRGEDKGFYVVDFFLKDRLLCIEIDGGYHETQQKEDKEREDFIRTTRGYEFLRYTNDQVKTLTIEQLKADLEKFPIKNNKGVKVCPSTERLVWKRQFWLSRKT